MDINFILKDLFAIGLEYGLLIGACTFILSLGIQQCIKFFNSLFL